MSFTIRIRGTPSRVTCAEYLCPAHGRFALDVERVDGDPPDAVPCPACALISIWVISAPLGKVQRVSAVRGRWTKPELPTYTDTRNVGEGQPLYEWKEDRAKVWEERRKADVMRFAKEH